MFVFPIRHGRHGIVNEFIRQKLIAFSDIKIYVRHGRFIIDKRHDFVTVDKQGNYKIGDDITGSFPGNGLEATGTCVIDVSYKYIEKTKEQFVREVANPDRRLLWTSGLLDGIIQHRIECTYKITRKSTDSNEFEITYTGTGAYALLANIISKVNGDVDVQALVDGVGQEISAADLVTDQVSFEGNVTLKYTAKIK